MNRPKALYVAAIHFLRPGFARLGLLKWLESSNSRYLLWCRSLFSIYDLEDLAGLDLPWWSFGAIDAVERFLAARKGASRVFEYGSGASSVWLARRSGSVTSIENEPAVARLVTALAGAGRNLDLRVVEPGDLSPETIARSNRQGFRDRSFDLYVNSIDEVGGEFDLIVIDGRARSSCLTKALFHLKPDGIILFDDSNRREYRPAIETCGLSETPMRGLAPSLPLPSQTSLLMRSTIPAMPDAS